MAIKRGAAIPQTPAAASRETPDKASVQAKAAEPLKDHSTPAAEPIPPVTATPTPPPISGAETAAGTAVASAQGGQLAHRDPVSDDGFDALDKKLGFGSFPIVKLDKEDFYKGDNKVGKEIFVAMLGVRAKYLYKEAGKQETEFLFYDYSPPSNPSAEVQNRLADWKTKGIPYEVKEYMEVASRLYLKQGDDYVEDSMVLLNVPPASVTRLAGYRMETRQFKGLKLNQALTRCIAGDIVKISSSVTFYPWQFEFVEKIDD